MYEDSHALHLCQQLQFPPAICSSPRTLLCNEGTAGGSHLWQEAHRRGTSAGCMLTSNAWIKN